jgi:hypothetical protein
VSWAPPSEPETFGPDTAVEPADLAPGAVCAVRDRNTGRVFLASDEEARELPFSRLHPILLERIRAEHDLFQLHQHLRRSRQAALVPGCELSTEAIGRHLDEHGSFIDEQLERWPLAPQVQGADSRHQFRRIQHAVASIEQGRAGGQPLSDDEWLALLSSNGNHAEVKATSDALFAIEASDCDALLRLELHTESGDERVDEPVPRCLHCRFITEGLDITPELRRVEIAAEARLRAGMLLE